MPQMQQRQTTHTGVQAHGGFGVAQASVQAMQLRMADRGVHQHGEEDADQGVAVHGRSDAPSTERQKQRKTSTQNIQHRPSEKAPLVVWPFMYSYRDGHCVVNKAQRISKYQEAQGMGEALI